MNSLLRAKITSYRSCINTKVEFNSGLTSLIGVNGSGKTNILKALVLLSKGGRRRYHATPTSLQKDMSSTIQADILLDQDTVSVRADHYFELSESAETTVYSEYSYKKHGIKTWSPIENIFFEYPPTLFKPSTSGSQLRYIISREVGKDEVDDMLLKSNIVKFLSSFSYYSATHFSNPTNCPVSLEFEDDKFVNTYRHSPVHEKFLRELYDTWKQDTAFRQFNQIVGADGLGLVNRVLFQETSLPGITSTVIVGGKIQTRQRNKRIAIPLVEMDDGSQLSFSQLSEGTFKTLALIFNILNDANELLMIEEPEVFIHHGLLSSLVELIKDQSRRKQIIISTHSDYVLDKLDAENVVLVRKDGNSGTIAASLEESMTLDDFKLLKDHLAETGGLGEYWRESGFEVE